MSVENNQPEYKEVNITDLLNGNEDTNNGTKGSNNNNNNDSQEGQGEGDVKFTDKQKEEFNKLLFKRRWEYKKKQLAAQRGGKYRYEERRARAELNNLNNGNATIINTKVDGKDISNIKAKEDDKTTSTPAPAPSKARIARLKRKQKKQQQKKEKELQNDDSSKVYEVKDQETGQTIKYHLSNEDAEL